MNVTRGVSCRLLYMASKLGSGHEHCSASERQAKADDMLSLGFRNSKQADANDVHATQAI